MEQFEFLECSICSEEVIEFAATFSSDKRFGEKACKHNFCAACIHNYMEYNIKNKKTTLLCPICREEFDGFIQNKTSNDLLKQARKLSSASIFLKNENSKLNEEINQIKNETENEIIQYKQKIKELEEFKNKQIQESTITKNKIKTMELEIQELEQNRLMDLENTQLKFDGQQQQILQLSQTNKELNNNLQQQQFKKQELAEQLQSLYKQIEQQNTLIDKLENEKKTILNDLNNLYTTTDRKIQEQIQLSKFKDAQILKLSEQNQFINESLTKVQAECNHFKKVYKEIQQDSSSGFKKIQDLEGAISALHIELSRSQSVIETLSMNKRTLEKELEETKLFNYGGGGSSIGSTTSSFIASSTPAIISNTANKITNSSYNIINNGIGYLMGKQPQSYLSPSSSHHNDITKPYKTFRIQEKRGNKSSQIHKVSVGNSSGSYVIKLIPTSSAGSGSSNSSKYMNLSNWYSSSTLTEQDILSFRESMLLYKLNNNNILKLESITKDDSTGKYYSVLSPFVPLDLEFILAENQNNTNFSVNGIVGKISPTTLTFPNIKFIIYQLISVVNYLHSQDLVHRDIKPTSILLFNDYQIKLCSFGQATSVFTSLANSISAPNYNNPSASYSYLSPEYICNILNNKENIGLDGGGGGSFKDFDWKAFDMWSVGCIFLELIYKRKLFNNQSSSSSNSNNNIELNFNNLSVNSNNNSNIQQLYSVLNNISTYKESAPKTGGLYFKENHNIIIKSKVERDFTSANLPADAYNLLCSLLTFNPTIRIKANQAVFHKFFKDEPYFICDSSSVSPTKHDDISSSLTDRNIKQFLKEKCSNLVQV